MVGCKYLKWDGMKQIEYCQITDEPTNGSMTCDCDYELCPHYIEAHKPLNGQGSERTGAGNQSRPKLIQTSIFGAAGEKPFNA